MRSPSRSSYLRFAAAFAVLLALWRPAHALDPPHNGRNAPGIAISCEACHYNTAGPTPSWATQQTTTDQTFFNNLCTSCHKPTTMTDSRYVVRTHSSGNTSTKHGIWSIECRSCHNPHYQDQVSGYPSDPDVDLLTGMIGAFVQPPLTASETTIPVNGGGLVTDAWIDHVFVPNVLYPTRMYRIKSNTATAVTVYGPVNGRYAAAGSSFSVRLGKMVLGLVPAPQAGPRQVKFFRENGVRSFGTSTDPSDLTSICQVCHTNTTSFNSFGTLEGPGHPSAVAGTECTLCHTHASGFKAQCGSCHGNPPMVSTLGGPNGLANNEGGTGATTPGAHVAHAVSMGYACDNCHAGGMPASTIYDKLIQMGFHIANGIYQSGSYDGRATLANGYSYTKGNAGTTITLSGTKVCSNVYCHGSTMAPNAGTDITPVWDVPSTGACGTCHGATAFLPPTKGSHYIHSRTDLLGYAYPCATCHRDPAGDASLHVNGRSEVLFSGASASDGSYTGTPAMLDAYGTCTNVYCHSTVQSSPPGDPPVYRVTPVWGQENFSCGACHDYATDLTTGSHGKHMEQPVLTECWGCHNYTGIDDGCMACHDPDSIQPKRDLHANHAVNVGITPRYGGNYSGSPAPGDAYGKCSNTYCHGNYPGSGSHATPTWGNASSGACGTCHGVPLSSGAHVWHTSTAFGIPTIPFSCGTCHNGIISGPDGGPYAVVDATKHVNKSVDWQFDTADSRFTVSSQYSITTGVLAPSDGTGRAYGKCSNLYCHSTVQGSNGVGPPASYDTPTWTAAGGGKCSTLACHGFGHFSNPPTTGSHTKHMDVLTSWFSMLHPVLCIVCHTTDPQAAINCLYCHDTSPLWRDQHANGAIEVNFLAAYGGPTATYSGTPAPGDGYGSCANAYCHGATLAPDGGTNTTPTWGDAASGQCGTCHGVNIMYNSPTRGAHRWLHAGEAVLNDVEGLKYPCALCHTDPSTDASLHANGLSEVTFSSTDPKVAGGLYSGTPAVLDAYGTCTNVYCHSNVQTSPPGGPLAYSSPNWGAALQYRCNNCHFGSSTMNATVNLTSITGMITGNHAAHFSYNFGCVHCHAYNPAFSSTVNGECIACHANLPSESARPNHANYAVDVNISNYWGASASYSGTPAPGDGYGSCSATYCHSNGTSVATGTIPAASTPSWGASGPLACDACHGNPPAYANGSPKANSHASASHAGSGCNTCHYATTTTGTSITDRTKHVDLSYEVTPDTVSGVSFSYVYAPSGGTCSSVSCHSGGVTRTWGQ